jgi:dihydroorotase
MRLHHVRVLTGAGLSAPTTVQLPVADGDDRDASGLILSPGLTDLHAHLRDPGFPQKETLESGAASAAFGGFTHVVAMANTNPVSDRPERLHSLIVRAQDLPIHVSFVGALTMGLEGGTLTDAHALRAAGAVALSDDGRHAMHPSILRLALEAAAEAGLPVLIHPQKEALGTGADAEAAAVAEALEVLATVRQARLHLQHVSTRAAVDLIRLAKTAGLPVTAEVTPHHLALSTDDAASAGPPGRVNPPLRTAEDRQAVREALVEGVIDAIATDHAPHEAAAKAAGANGFHGFETVLGIVLSLGLDYRVIYRACVQRPREIIGAIDGGEPAEGDAGDWILIDPELDWTVDPSSFRSRGKNSPFAGRRLHGRAVMTVCRGQVLFERMVQRV